MEKLIEKNLTRKEQVDELEEVWKFLSKNNLGHLFEKLVAKGVTRLERLRKINRLNAEEYKLGLYFAEKEDLLSVLEKVNILNYFFLLFSQQNN